MMDKSNKASSEKGYISTTNESGYTWLDLSLLVNNVHG